MKSKLGFHQNLLGTLLVGLGASVLAGWFARSMTLVQVYSSFAPMQANTAVCFMLGGLGLVLPGRGHFTASSVCGGLVGLIAGASLAEYVLDVNLGIDTLLVDPWTTTRTSHPGRMSPLTAACFFIAAVALLLGRPAKWQISASAVGGMLVCAIAGTTLFGYAAGIETALGWGPFTRMAVHTAAGFLMLGTGLFLNAARAGQLTSRHPLRSMQLPTGLALILLLGLIASRSQRELGSATEWRRHEYEVWLALEQLKGHLAKIRIGTHGFIITGDETFLEAHQVGTNAAPGLLQTVRALTADNPVQQAVLDELGPLAQQLAEWHRIVSELRRSSGFDAARREVAARRGDQLLAEATTLVGRMEDEERRLLALRDKAVWRGARDTSVLLLTLSVVAFALVGLAGWRTQREMRRRNRSEMELQRVASWQKAILDNAAYSIISTTPEGIVTTFNRAAERMLGYNAAELVGCRTPEIIHDPDEVAARADEFSAQLGQRIEPGFEVFVAKARHNLPNDYEWTYVRKNGSRFPVLLSVTAMRDDAGAITGFLGIASDVTERMRAEKAIKDSLAEKEILLREIHHRVKNNMQVISRILSLQAGYTEDEHARSFFADCQARVQCMAMIHEKLYRSQNLATLDFGTHVRDLSESLVRSFGATARRVNLVVEADTVPLDIDIAIPVGLILNELITNALKYAFPAGRSGVIRVRFRLEGPASLLLSVADDGIGLPEEMEIDQARSLGLKMIRSLIRQLNGVLELRCERGAEFRIRFPLPAAFANKAKLP